MAEPFIKVPDAALRAGHNITDSIVLLYFARCVKWGDPISLAQAGRTLGLNVKTVKRSIVRLTKDPDKLSETYGQSVRETYGTNCPDVMDKVSESIGQSVRPLKIRSRRTGDGRFAKPSSLTDQPTELGNSLKSTKGLEEPGPRSDRIDQADAPIRPEEEFDELHPPPPDWDWGSPVTEPWMTADPYGQPGQLTSGSTIANRPVPNPQPSADRSFKANSERNPEVESKEEIKPPPDKARLNGWHLAKKVYYRVQFPGGGKPNLQPADITDPDELKDWASLGCKVEKLEIEEVVDRAGRTVRPEAVEEEKDKQKKFRQSVSQKGGQSNGKEKRPRANKKRNEDVGPLPGTEAGTSTTEP